MYCRAGQSSEEDMYNNESSGPAFEEFLDLLGERVRLKGWEKYRAQLDNKSELHSPPSTPSISCISLCRSAGIRRASVSHWKPEITPISPHVIWVMTEKRRSRCWLSPSFIPFRFQPGRDSLCFQLGDGDWFLSVSVSLFLCKRSRLHWNAFPLHALPGLRDHVSRVDHAALHGQQHAAGEMRISSEG